jgi:hypothetical protein
MFPTCSPADVLNIFQPVTGAANVSKVVDNVIKASGTPGISWGFVVSGLVAIVAINYTGAPKLEKLNSEAQADRLLQYQMSASRLSLMNAWM